MLCFMHCTNRTTCAPVCIYAYAYTFGTSYIIYTYIHGYPHIYLCMYVCYTHTLVHTSADSGLLSWQAQALVTKFPAGKINSQHVHSFTQHLVPSNYLKSPKPGGPSHLLLLAKDNIFGLPIGAWFTLTEDDNHLVHLDLNDSFRYYTHIVQHLIWQSIPERKIIEIKYRQQNLQYIAYIATLHTDKQT